MKPRNPIEKRDARTATAALKHTLSITARAADAILEVGPTVVRAAGVTALVVDQASFPGGTVADQLKLPFATVCNALLLNPDPAVPPYFTHWQPRDSWWARIRNRIARAGLNRLYAPILTRIQTRRRHLGLPVPVGIAVTWSDRLQISQQPEIFEFPRRALPKHVRFVGPLRLPVEAQPVPFPWERLDQAAADLRFAGHTTEPYCGHVSSDCGGVQWAGCPIDHLDGAWGDA